MDTENDSYLLKCVLEKLEEHFNPDEAQELCVCAQENNNTKKQGE
jgi:hypothetical protein